VNAREKSLEAWIGPNRVRHRLDRQINHAVVALLNRAIQPHESLFFVAEAEIDAA
jgi:hypothetical protein